MIFFDFLSESLASGLVTTKPKKRAYLLKRKALTTSFFDNKEKGEQKTQYPSIARLHCSGYFYHDEIQLCACRIPGDIIYIVQYTGCLKLFCSLHMFYKAELVASLTRFIGSY